MIHDILGNNRLIRKGGGGGGRLGFSFSMLFNINKTSYNKNNTFSEIFNSN